MREGYFSTLGRQMREAFVRFPLPLVVASITALALAAIPWFHEDSNEFAVIINIIMVGGPLFLLILSRTIVGQYRGGNRAWGSLLDIILLSAGIGVFWALPLVINFQLGLEAFVWFIALHGLVAITPVLGRLTHDGLWLFNWKLFTRILTAFLFSHVLYGGILILLVTLNEIFGLDWEMNKLSLSLYSLILGIFNSWFLCGGIPHRSALEGEKLEFPASLKVFNFYILLPVTLLSVLVCLLFFVDWLSTDAFSSDQNFLTRMLDNDLNIGVVIGTSIFSSIVAMLFVLLAYPAERENIFPWSKPMSQSVVLLLLPATLVCLLPSINSTFSSDTETGYYYLALTLLLSSIALIVTAIPALHQRKLFIVPAALFALGIISVLGPFSSRSIVGGIHMQQFRDTLIQKNMLNEVGLIQHGDTLDYKSLYYQVNNYYRDYGYSWFQELTETDLDDALADYSGSQLTVDGQTHNFKPVDSLRAILLFPYKHSLPQLSTEKPGLSKRHFNLSRSSSHGAGRFPYIVPQNHKLTLPVHVDVYSSRRSDTVIVDGVRQVLRFEYIATNGTLLVKRNNGPELTMSIVSDSLRAVLQADDAPYMTAIESPYNMYAETSNLRVTADIFAISGAYTRYYDKPKKQDGISVKHISMFLHLDW